MTELEQLRAQVEAQKEEIDQLTKKVTDQACDKGLLRVELADVTRQRDEAMKDAERYRWLRNEAKAVDWAQWIDIHNGSYYCNCRTTFSGMDEAIDAAIQGSKKP